MSKEMHASLKTAVKGTTLIVAGMVIGNLLWFAIKILIVRNISVDELGLYSLTITIATVLSALAALGTHMGTPRNISSFLGKERHEDAQSLARASLHINFISSMTIGILLFLLSGLLSRHVFYKPEIATLLKIISVSIPLFTMATIIGGILRGYGYVGHKVYYMDIGYPLYSYTLTP
jgi:O-antigen/teichoic acid export membrane protein